MPGQAKNTFLYILSDSSFLSSYNLASSNRHGKLWLASHMQLFGTISVADEEKLFNLFL
jgi:hypothetical protein